MSIINDDPNAQAAADESRGIAPVIGGNPIPINVRKEGDDTPSMPEGGLKPLSKPTQINIDIDAALADDTPGTASFEGPKEQKDLSDFSEIGDFIETPVDDIQEEVAPEAEPEVAPETEKPAGKSIDIVDKTPEAEDLFSGDNEEVVEEKVAEEEKVEPIAPVEPVEPVAPIEPIAPIEPVEPVAPVAPIEHNVASAEINIDAEHAYEEANEDFFRATREKISNLRRERNECIVAADKKEDELTTIERLNSQYEIAGAFEKIDREHVDSLRNEIRDLRGQADTKDKAIRSSLKIIRAL